MGISETTIIKYEGGTDIDDQPTSVFSATIDESGAVSLNFELAQANLFSSDETQRAKFMDFIETVLDKSEEISSGASKE